MKKIFFSVVSALFFFSLSGDTIYEEIKKVPFDGVGYFAAEKMLDQLFKKNDIKTVIEIGSWAGASTRFFARRVGENGKVYAVDHWLGTKESNAEIQDSRLPNIYHLFLSNIYNTGLNNRIIPLRMSSEEGLKALEHVSADLVFIDGPKKANEVYESVLKWSKHLNENGIICGTEFREKGVETGVREASKDLCLKVKTDVKGLTWVLY